MDEDGSFLRFNHDKLPHFDHAYGLTIHKGQGMTVDTANMLLEMIDRARNGGARLQAVPGNRLNCMPARI